MTYIVAFGQPGYNTIIADCRATLKGAPEKGGNRQLKTGLLCPGTIYGFTGEVRPARAFIVAFKETIFNVEDTLAGFWQRFERFAALYPYPLGQSFDLILSTRAKGQPGFALLSPKAGLVELEVPHPYYTLTYGSGKGVLDERVRAFSDRLKACQEYLHSQQMKPPVIRAVSPYFLTLWLSEMTLTIESQVLEAAGVGGVFHFVGQDSSGEAAQRPAIYLFSSANRRARTIYGWGYRVAAVQGGLLVERHDPIAREVVREAFFDSAARRDIETYDETTLAQMVESDLQTLPFYFFCGFGFTEPQERKSFGCVISSKGAKSEIFDEEGRLNPRLAALIANNFGTP